jgi:hypothetical protein
MHYKEMNSTWHWMHTDWAWPVLLGCGILFVAFLAKELLHRKKQGLPWRIFVVLVAIFALTMLLLKPAYPTSVDKGIGVLLTEGYEQSVLDSLQRVHGKMAMASYDAAKDLFSFLDSLGQVYVLGNGIPSYDLWQVHGLSTTFLPGQVPTGISEIRYGNDAILGEEVSITGFYERPQMDHRLLLVDPGGNVLDSIVWKNSRSQPFEFSLAPKATGTFVYGLWETDADRKILKKEPLPLHVHPPKPLSVLMLYDFPTFEAKYLKNFLAKKGHAVVVRSQLTTDRFKFEYVNTPQNPIYTLTEDQLTRFDLVILDRDTYDGLGAKARDRLMTSVRRQGLGLFLQPNENSWAKRKNLLEVVRDNRTQWELQTDDNVVLNKYPYTFQMDFPVQPILFGGVEVAAYRPLGLGKVGSTVLQPTYPLVLKGKQPIYERLWSQIVTMLAKPGGQNGELLLSTELPRPHEPLHIALRTAVKNPEVTTLNGTYIPLQQELWLPMRWLGVHYPQKIGWQQFLTATDTTDYYVYSDTVWQTRAAFLTQAANSRALGAMNVNLKPGTRWAPIDPFWWYGLLLLALGFLWLWPKVN